jgi:hypothetical protein
MFRNGKFSRHLFKKKIPRKFGEEDRDEEDRKREGLCKLCKRRRVLKFRVILGRSSIMELF